MLLQWVSDYWLNVSYIIFGTMTAVIPVLMSAISANKRKIHGFFWGVFATCILMCALIAIAKENRNTDKTANTAKEHQKEIDKMPYIIDSAVNKRNGKLLADINDALKSKSIHVIIDNYNKPVLMPTAETQQRNGLPNSLLKEFVKKTKPSFSITVGTVNNDMESIQCSNKIIDQLARRGYKSVSFSNLMHSTTDSCVAGKISFQIEGNSAEIIICPSR